MRIMYFSIWLHSTCMHLVRLSSNFTEEVDVSKWLIADCLWGFRPLNALHLPMKRCFLFRPLSFTLVVAYILCLVLSCQKSFLLLARSEFPTELNSAGHVSSCSPRNTCTWSFRSPSPQELCRAFRRPRTVFTSMSVSSWTQWRRSEWAEGGVTQWQSQSSGRGWSFVF